MNFFRSAAYSLVCSNGTMCPALSNWYTTTCLPSFVSCFTVGWMPSYGVMVSYFPATTSHFLAPVLSNFMLGWATIARDW